MSDNNKEDVKYGVIHEIGDYSNIKPLSDKDNKIFKEQQKLKNKE